MSHILVGMSGGVDSSATAAKLLDAGTAVTGIHLTMHGPWESGAAADAERVARHLGIELLREDVRDPFREKVLTPWLDQYRAGRTPNPCILCNRAIKFHLLVERARELGMDGVATGHYARIEGAPGARILCAGANTKKDQSYFLVPRHRAVLDRVLFPLGEMTSKDEVRRYAAAKGLPVASKSDSQDVCFIPEGDTRRYLVDHLGDVSPGPILDVDGNVVGAHEGAALYTIGQRRGLGVSAPTPLYVIARDPAANTITLGPRARLMAGGLTGSDPVWLTDAPPTGELRCGVKIRSTAPAVPCTATIEGADVRVRFDTPQFGVAPGQMAVFYEGDRVLGGAWIEGEHGSCA